MKIWLDEYFTETKDTPAFKWPRKRATKPPATKRRVKNAAVSSINDDDRRLLKSLIGG